MKSFLKKLVILFLVCIVFLCGIYLMWFYLVVPKMETPDAKYKRPTVIRTEKGKVKIPVDFKALKKVNPEVCAWLRIEGTELDYPIVQSQKGEEFYLKHSWEGELSGAGAIFIQNYNHADFSDYNTVVYGHRIGSGDTSMFHGLYGYMDEDFCKEHSQIFVYTPDHIRTYEVFASVVYDDRLIPKEFDDGSEASRKAYLESIYASQDSRNLYVEGMNVTAEDQILTLSTCLEYERHHRYLVLAVLVDEQ